MPKFNMNAVGGGAASELRYVDLEHLHASEYSGQIYTTENIEELAASIKINSLLHPPLVRDMMNGEYVIISGHRRVLALRKLVEEGHEEFKKVPVLPVVDYDENSVKFKTLTANAEARVLTNAEKLAQAQEYMKVMSIHKENVNLPGRVRDTVAKMMKMSSGALGELLALPNKLHPALLEHFKQGTINQTAAIELSKLPNEDQQIYAEWVDNGKEISTKQVRHYRKQKEEEALAEKAARDEATCPSMFTAPEPKQEQEKEEQKEEKEETAPPAPVIAENATTEVIENQEVPPKTEHKAPKAEQEDVHQYENSYNDMSHDIRDIMTAMVMIKNACTSLSKHTNCTKCPLFKDNQCSFIHKTKPSYYNWLDGIQL